MNRTAVIIFILVFLTAFAAVASFVVPAYGEHCWYSFSDIIAKTADYPFLESGSYILGYFFRLFGNYHLNCDKGFIPLIANFPGYYAEGAHDSLVYLNRPLYPALASLLFMIIRPVTGMPDFIAAFASAIILNVFLASAAVIMFYFLVRYFFSASIAFLSAALFIFSPFFHVFISQPIAEILSAFAAVCALFLLARYVARPSREKLVLFSLLFGVLMLGKMIYALAFFIIFLAWYFRRFKEAVIFAVFQSVPLAVWFLFVKQGLGMPYYIHEINYGDNATAAWLFNIINNSWQETASIIIHRAPDFFANTVQGFLLAPLILAAYGWYLWRFPHKNILVFGYSGAFFLLSCIMVFWQPRLSFLLFPVVYPLAALGLEVMRDRFGYVAFVAMSVLIVFISNSNVYKLVNYG